MKAAGRLVQFHRGKLYPFVFCEGKQVGRCFLGMRKKAQPAGVIQQRVAGQQLGLPDQFLARAEALSGESALR